MVTRGLAVLLAIVSAAAAAAPPRPIVIAHRGASGHRPEHTLEAYRLAVEMGADFIEPDLVSTKDGVLIARHENEIGATTDVADRFPDRQRTKTIDGQTITGWFSEDFTLAEIKTLRARERLPFRSHAFDRQFEIPTFDEVVALAQRLGAARGRRVGVYPETKHPTYFRSIKLPLEDPLLASLEKKGWNTRDAPVFIQSFEQSNLRELRKMTKVRLVQLVSTPALLTDAGLKDIASYADGLGPEKRLVIPVNADGSLGTPTDVIARAHALGLVVHVWTLRPEKAFLPAAYKGDAAAEFEQFRQLGADGVFTDVPDVGVKAYTDREATTSRSSELAGTSWRLVKFQGSDDTTLTPDDRAKYTIEFGEDGRLIARVDCNRGRGTWKSSGSGNITFGPMALTRAKCPPGSLHDQIVKQWPNIRSYVIRDGHLFLSLMADGGIYEFEPVEKAKQ